MKVTVGSDFEFFVHNGDVVVPAGGGLVPGTKAQPFSTGDGFFIQEDGASIEVNTPVLEINDTGRSPTGVALGDLVVAATDRAIALIKKRVKTKEAVSNSVRARLNLLSRHVERYTGAEFTFTDEQLKLAGPDVFVVGCDPDFTAYSPLGMENNSVIDLTELGGTRMAGGHIHIGYDTTQVPEFVLVQFMDLFCAYRGLISNAGTRAKYYGRPGNFRRKPYGIEYRTLTTNALFNRGTINDVLSNVYRLLHNVDIAREFYEEFPWDNFRNTWYSNRKEWTERTADLVNDLYAAHEERRKVA